MGRAKDIILMIKKEYKKPVMKVVELESTSILADSDPKPNPKFKEIEIDNNPYNGPWG